MNKQYVTTHQNGTIELNVLGDSIVQSIGIRQESKDEIKVETVIEKSSSTDVNRVPKVEKKKPTIASTAKKDGGKINFNTT